MDESCKIIKSLDELLAFLKPLHSLANSHFGELFSANLWETLVPKNIQLELNSLESINDFIQLYPDIIKNKCPYEFAKNHPNLVNFIQNAVSICTHNDKKYLKCLADMENLFIRKGCSVNLDFKLEEFMSIKKLHEVRKSSKITALLANFVESSHVVDVGGGKGYLSFILALHHSFKVLSLDCSEVNTCGALKRSEKLVKLWNDGIFDKSQNEEKFTSSKKKEVMKNYLKQNVTFVNPYTNLPDLLKENFEDEVTGITVTGLHTCGNLAPTCLKMFLNNEKIKAILNVGCCFHAIKEEFCSDDSEKIQQVEDLENHGFPLSNYLRRKKYFLGKNTRMLAAHSLEKMNSYPDFEKSQKSLLFRAILETVKINNNISWEGQVGRLAKKCDNFNEYMQKASKKLGFSNKIETIDLDKLYDSYQDKKPFLTAFFLLRVTLAPIIESIILLDRILYLTENGINNAYLVRLFDLEISPRGFGVIAWKDFKSA